MVAPKRTIGQPMGHLFFGGVSSNELAPFTFPVSVGDFPYQIDYKRAPEQFSFEPVDILRQQSDQRDTPGEHSINPAGLWRRSGDSWHLGAGQDFFDRDNSSPYRFKASTGIDIWTKWQLKLLMDTGLKMSSANTNLFMAVAGTDWYVLDGSALKRTTNLDTASPTITALTGTPPANNGTSIASDGFHVWTAHGASGIWRTTRGTAAWAAAAHITGTINLVAFVRGRVLAANNNIIYDVTTEAMGAGGVGLPTALFTHPNSDFKFTSIAEGRNAIYLAGYSGDKSLIYKAIIKSDGTGLDAPTVAGEFDGEQIESLFGYLGPFLFIGVGLAPGWRFAQINQNGDLTIGARVVTPKPVLCFEGQENFVWWGYSNYSATLTGLGRLNTQAFGDPDNLVPAWASDMMATGSIADVQSVVTFQGIRVFSVKGVGVYATHSSRNLVSSGTLDTGEILFNMNQDKIGLYVDVISMANLGSTHGFYISIDGGTFAFLGEHTEHLQPFVVGQVKARTFQLRLELKRDGAVFTAGQVLSSWLFRAQPVPTITRLLTIPLLIADPIIDDDGDEHAFDTWAAMNNIIQLQRTKSITQLRWGKQSYPVIVEDDKWRFWKLVDPLQGFGLNATCIATFKVMSQEVAA